MGSAMKPSAPSLAEVVRTSGLLAVISAFILVEGVVRTDNVINTPSDKWGGNYHTFPPVVLLIGGVVEVLFGLSGLAVGLAQCILNIGSPMATMGTILCQCLGWFTFVVYTMAAPGFTQARNDTAIMGLSLDQTRAITAMGILGSIAVCFCLQGSQFFVAFKLHKLQTGQGAIYNGEYHRSRLVTFTAFVLIGGGTQLACGAILREGLGSGRFMSPVVAPPYMVFYPEITIALGVLEVLYGLYLVLVAVGAVPRTRSTGVTVAAVGAVVFVCHVALQNLAQSWGGMALIIVGSQLVGLNFTYCLFPAYLAFMLCAQDYAEAEVAPEGAA